MDFGHAQPHRWFSPHRWSSIHVWRGCLAAPRLIDGAAMGFPSLSLTPGGTKHHSETAALWMWGGLVGVWVALNILLHRTERLTHSRVG